MRNKVITLTEVAKKLNIDRSTLYEWKYEYEREYGAINMQSAWDIADFIVAMKRKRKYENK
jgi:transposase-like protein